MDASELEKQLLDLRGVACPLNFVKTKLFLDKLSAGQMVTVMLDAGEPVESVSNSVEAEGHRILQCLPDPAGYYRLSIQKS